MSQSLQFKTKAGSIRFWKNVQKLTAKDSHALDEIFAEIGEGMADFRYEVELLINKFTKDKITLFNIWDGFLHCKEELFWVLKRAFPGVGDNPILMEEKIRKEFIHWVINEYFLFRNKDGVLTQYALICGYIQEEVIGQKRVTLHSPNHGVYEVSVMVSENGLYRFIGEETFKFYLMASKAYKKQVRKLKKENK